MEDKNYRLCRKGHKNLLVAKYCKYDGEPLEVTPPPDDDEEEPGICPQCGMPYKFALWLKKEISNINANLQKLLQRLSTPVPGSDEEDRDVVPHEEVPPAQASTPVGIEEQTQPIVQHYNKALSSDKEKRKSFLQKYKPIRVSIIYSDQIKTGAYVDPNFMPEFERNPKGDFLMTEIGKSFFLYPNFDLNQSHYWSIVICFDLEKSETPSTRKGIIQELKKPGECKKLTAEQWKLQKKGIVVMKTWPPPLL
jgi:hypothetical protein